MRAAHKGGRRTRRSLPFTLVCRSFFTLREGIFVVVEAMVFAWLSEEL